MCEDHVRRCSRLVWWFSDDLLSLTEINRFVEAKELVPNRPSSWSPSLGCSNDTYFYATPQTSRIASCVLLTSLNLSKTISRRWMTLIYAVHTPSKEKLSSRRFTECVIYSLKFIRKCWRDKPSMQFNVNSGLLRQKWTVLKSWKRSGRIERKREQQGNSRKQW